MVISLEKWLETQGFPHGFECIGIERMQQVWDAAQDEEREACAMECEVMRISTFPEIMEPRERDSHECADAIRSRK